MKRYIHDSSNRFELSAQLFIHSARGILGEKPTVLQTSSTVETSFMPPVRSLPPSPLDLLLRRNVQCLCAHDTQEKTDVEVLEIVQKFLLSISTLLLARWSDEVAPMWRRSARNALDRVVAWCWSRAQRASGERGEEWDYG